jgi:hypothetical protein
VLEVRHLRELIVGDADPGVGLAALSAASGLVRWGQHLFVIADDETQLARFDLSNGEPGRLIAMFDGPLPRDHQARKAAKPDCEALLVLPAFAGHLHGALMALGSGSRPSRQRAALWALDAAGEVDGPARCVDLSALLAPLHHAIADLNIEGGFVQGATLCLLQRGNSASALNARIDLSWPAVQAWLQAADPAPAPLAITPFELGAIDGVPLSFTDGAALPGGGWLFSAAAEETTDSYADGACAGSAIGWVDADGKVVALERLSLRCKVEGISATVVGKAIELLLVTDADDRSQPALLLGASLEGSCE